MTNIVGKFWNFLGYPQEINLSETKDPQHLWLHLNMIPNDTVYYLVTNRGMTVYFSMKTDSDDRPNGDATISYVGVIRWSAVTRSYTFCYNQMMTPSNVDVSKLSKISYDVYSQELAKEFKASKFVPPNDDFNRIF